MELDKKFDFKSVDKKWSEHWVDKNLFHAEADSSKEPYVIVIPPPNVTGILHMGHALNNTLQDIIIRYKRMSGKNALWMVGTDHAGIATQNVVEKALAKEGKTRHDLGREKFLKKLWEWTDQYGGTIIHQLKKLGASCDWPRQRFTMDEGYSQAVLKVFVELYKKDLIYRGERIINWCPRCHTALSDEESEHEDHNGTLTHIRYPFKNDSTKYVIVATTRPETMLGDTAVAVNPLDERYKNLIGQTLILPITNREIKIIADEFVDPTFGSGAVKVTPAHDPNDFDMGQRHNLEFINIMNESGIINDNGGAFQGMDRFEAREAIVSTLKEENLIEKIEDHHHSVGHCYRCHTVVEPRLSKQWFVRMAPLAKPAVDVVKSGEITIYPERWSKTYLNWMDNIRDWCISRQIWWGHRIPVWYDEHDNIFVASNEEDAKQQAKEKHGKEVALRQDEDVLDTWFSSWLWPFATLGWPQENADVKYFHPGSALFTASEIIFFWVARMIMASLEFRGEIPFKDVYIHGTVRDAKGRKMSKSLGNAIDPLEIIDEYGADALRFSLIINSGDDLYISKEKFEIGRNFANKIWNATRLILMNVKDVDADFDLSSVAKGNDLPSKWIVAQLYKTIDDVAKAIDAFKYSEAEGRIYDFFWGNFCDWYLEIIKNQWSDAQIQNTAYKVLELSLTMMHPFIPFVTEEIWSNIRPGEKELCLQEWPRMKTDLIDPVSIEQMSTLIEIVSTIRNLRAEWNVKPAEKITCHFAGDKTAQNLITNNAKLIQSLANVEIIKTSDKLEAASNTANGIVGSINLSIPLGDVIDVDKERKRVLSQLENQRKQMHSLANRLDNKEFLDKAPSDVIDKETVRLKSMKQTIEKLENLLTNLQ